jgi:dienelactone hydrolase
LIAACAALGGCGSSEEPAAAVTSAPSPPTTVPERPRETPAPAAAPATAGAQAVPIFEQTLAYGEGRRSNLVGYLAMPQDAAEPLPGIIVIHEWWGLNDEGGEWSLQTALQYPGALDAAVMYYGRGVFMDRDRLAPLNVPVLGFYGGDDKSIPVRQVQEFRARLLELGKNAEVLIVPHADHSFANPSSAGYNVQAANEAWTTTLAFLERHLKAR